MFWSQVDDNSINDLLSKEDVTLEEVLDHESILQECKIQNEKLVKFFCSKDHFSSLLNYVLITPSEEIEEKIRFKYPSLICEVLTSDVQEINDLLVNGIPSEVGGNPSSFTDRVFDIFDIERSINPLTISYILKILLNILKHNNDKVMNTFLNRSDSLDLLLKHVENNAIACFFSEFLMCDEECTVTRIKWLSENELIYKCAQLFSETENRNNAVQELICEVIRASWKYFANKDVCNEIKKQLNGKMFLDLLFAHITNAKAESSLITGCLRVVRTIVDFEIDVKDKKNDTVKEMILKHFDSLTLLMSSPPKQMYDPMPTTIGPITPFGPTRLEIVYLLESLLKLNDSEINSGIGQTNILTSLLAFVSQYRWNTLFQLGLLKIFDLLFADLTATCQYKTLLGDLVSKSNVYNWFVATMTEMTESQKPRPGTMGLLWKLGNHLNGLQHSQIAEELNIKEPDNVSAWSTIVSEQLEPRNNRNVIVAPKIDSCFSDIKMVDIDEDAMERSDNQEKPNIFGDFSKNQTDILNDIFGTSATVDDDDWIENELSLPKFGDFPDVLGSQIKSTSSLDDDDDDSSSEDELAPTIIKQKKGGNEAKYLFTKAVDAADNNGNGDLSNLYEVPDFNDEAISNFTFDDPWKTKSSETSSVQDNWASFS